MRPFVAVVAACAAGSVAALDDGLALTPPRGWRSWNLFGLRVNQSLMEQVADALAKPRSGGKSLAQLGYSDVGVDDGWQEPQPGGGFHNRTTGAPIVNKTRFSDLKGMVDYAHGLGLTASWYGNNCWEADPWWSLLAFQGDVQLVVDAGFDGVKYDSCGALKDIQLYATLLNASSPKPVLIENCHNGPWQPDAPRLPAPRDQPWCPFHMWRSSTDLTLDWGVIFGENLRSTIAAAAGGLSRPGCWAYPDMLGVGIIPADPPVHPGDRALSFTESRTHFGAWAIVSSPLVLGFDVRNDSQVEALLPVIGNEAALAVNAAWAGHPGTLLSSTGNISYTPCGFWPTCSTGATEVWWKPLPGSGPTGGAVAAVLLINHDASAVANVTVAWADVPGLACAGGCEVYDIWAQRSLGGVPNGLTVPLLPHDSAFFTVG